MSTLARNTKRYFAISGTTRIRRNARWRFSHDSVVATLIGLCLEVHGRKEAFFAAKRETIKLPLTSVNTYVRGQWHPVVSFPLVAHAHGFDSFAKRKEESRSIGYARTDAAMLFCSLIRNNDRFPVGKVQRSDEIFRSVGHSQAGEEQERRLTLDLDSIPCVLLVVALYTDLI